MMDGKDNHSWTVRKNEMKFVVSSGRLCLSSWGKYYLILRREESRKKIYSSEIFLSPWNKNLNGFSMRGSIQSMHTTLLHHC